MTHTNNEGGKEEKNTLRHPKRERREGTPRLLFPSMEREKGKGKGNEKSALPSTIQMMLKNEGKVEAISILSKEE